MIAHFFNFSLHFFRSPLRDLIRIISQAADSCKGFQVYIILTLLFIDSLPRQCYYYSIKL